MRHQMVAEWTVRTAEVIGYILPKCIVCISFMYSLHHVSYISCASCLCIIYILLVYHVLTKCIMFRRNVCVALTWHGNLDIVLLRTTLYCETGHSVSPLTDSTLSLSTERQDTRCIYCETGHPFSPLRDRTLCISTDREDTLFPLDKHHIQPSPPKGNRVGSPSGQNDTARGQLHCFASET